MATIDDFKKLELKVAEIKEVNEHPNADKLYIITLDLGDRTKQVVLVDNLDSAVLRGVESQGMLLAASDETGITIISPERKMKLGSIVK